MPATQESRPRTRPALLDPIFRRVSGLGGVGRYLSRMLAKVAGPEIVDPLWRLPFALLDRRYSPMIAEINEPAVATMEFTIDKHEPDRRRRPYKVRCHHGRRGGELSQQHFPGPMKGPRRRLTLSRRQLTCAMLGLAAIPILAANADAKSEFYYRGFAVDITAARDAANFPAIKASLEHQLDIVADCRAKPDIIDFFRGRRITLAGVNERSPGDFAPDHGIDVEARELPPQEPIILHEMLHAYHFYALPGGVNNPDIQLFYERAKLGHLYPETENHNGATGATLLLSDAREFFAVTASAFLSGHVDREPYSRERLKMLQPFYYDWLERVFGT